MNVFFSEYWPHIASVSIGLGAAWTLVSKMHKAFMKHFTNELRDTFASKQDIAQLNEKLDFMMQLIWAKSHAKTKPNLKPPV